MNIALDREEFDATLSEARRLFEESAKVPRELIEVLIRSMHSCIEIAGVYFETSATSGPWQPFWQWPVFLN